jgi:hypothetical protein
MESGSLIGDTKVHSKSERPLRRTIKEYLAVVGVLRIPNHAPATYWTCPVSVDSL